VAGQPIVLYAGNDRRGGHIFKFVSSQPYTAGMTKAQQRALLDDGTLYVAQFAGLDNTHGRRLASGAVPSEAAPGQGRWLELSITSTDVAPNAAALGDPARTIGAALRDVNWNGLGGFTTDADVRRALFTAALKVGVMELNRPEDLEWNPRDHSGTPRLYVAFTNHDRQVALDGSGKLTRRRPTRRRRPTAATRSAASLRCRSRARRRPRPRRPSRTGRCSRAPTAVGCGTPPLLTTC
jgi:secreted PhoX family phosphatase